MPSSAHTRGGNTPGIPLASLLRQLGTYSKTTFTFRSSYRRGTWSSPQACSMNFTESSNGDNGIRFLPNSWRSRSTSLWSKNSTPTSMIQRTALQNNARCGGMSSISMRRPLMIFLTPPSSLLTEKNIWRTPSTYTCTHIIRPSWQRYAHSEEDSSWMLTGPHGSCCERISPRSLRHGAYFLTLPLPLPLTLLILMLTGKGWYMDWWWR